MDFDADGVAGKPDQGPAVHHGETHGLASLWLCTVLVHCEAPLGGTAAASIAKVGFRDKGAPARSGSAAGTQPAPFAPHSPVAAENVSICKKT
ncbi:hypothetical protein GCM10027195_36110 [Comamonas sediminis]